MRFKNFSREIVRVEQVWRPRRESDPEFSDCFTLPTTLLGSPVKDDDDSHITIAHVYDPGYISEDYDPEDPFVRLLLKAHPELKPYVVPSVWERLLKREL